MKWTTANVKNPNYTGNHEIYVGTHTGSFKKIQPAYEDNPFAQTNLHELSKLNKESGITALAFGNEERSEIIIGRGHQTVEIHSLRSETVVRNVDYQAPAIVGVARFDQHLIAGSANGQVESILLDDEKEKPMVFSAGDNMAHLRQCNAQRNLIATGGKGRSNNLKIFDLSAEGKLVFTSKNLPNDFLQLEVPVWDSDIGFIDGPHTLATCSRHGYVRLYDTRKQRRPVQCFATDDHMSFTSLTAHGNYIYTGTTIGALKAFDIRRMKTFVHTYKGFTGGISDVYLDESGKYLSSACLDRYVRVHHADSTMLLYQCYVKSKATRVLLRQSMENPNVEVDNEPEELNEEQLKSKSKSQSSDDDNDDEYDDIFDNMQTVCENDAENDSEPEETRANEIKTNMVAASKRKALTKTGKTKKKKNKE